MAHTCMNHESLSLIEIMYASSRKKGLDSKQCPNTRLFHALPIANQFHTNILCINFDKQGFMLKKITAITKLYGNIIELSENIIKHVRYCHTFKIHTDCKIVLALLDNINFIKTTPPPCVVFLNSEGRDHPSV